MEPKSRDQYEVVSPETRHARMPGTIGEQLQAMTGCTVEQAGQAFVFLCRVGKVRREIELLKAEIERLTAVGAGALCSGWLNQRGDGRWYCHHRDGDPCPHPDHAGRGRVRKYVSEANFDSWGKAIADYRRLGECRGELSHWQQELREHNRFLERW